ncbi:MAG: ParA family protein [Methylococcales bacterium]|nr:ParA family protein [Methylococcales bacterium]
MAARVVAIINQKGGVGKTTTSTNLAHALANSHKKVTVIDLDPQGHLAVSFGTVNPNIPGIDDVMLDKKDIAKNLVQVRKNLQLIVAGTRLKEIEQLSEGGADRGRLLRKALHENLKGQDLIFIDCPPSSGLLVANALFAADEVLIPMAGDFLALQGLSHMMGTIKRFENVLKKKYKLFIVMSRYASTRKMSKNVLNKVLQYFPNQVLSTAIRESALLAECPSYGQTILDYRPGSRPARDFRSLSVDFLEGRVM